MNLGNTTGRQRKLAAPDKPAPGCFNVNAQYDWIIGGKLPDERIYQNRYQGRTYSIGKQKQTFKRYF